MNKRKHNGFTLVEMAIIVVLGGILLAAGVMAGRGMISRAQTQDILQIVGDLQGAATNFKQRFGALPGDWVFVANQIPTVTTGGNADGLIGGTLTTVAPIGLATAGAEIELAVQHLYYAGMIGKMGADATQRLQTQFGPVHMASNVAAITNAAYVTAYPSVRNVIVFYNLPCDVILELERSLDDGNDQTGRARGSAACTAGGTTVRYWVPLQ